jgi:hypothetical protein
VSIPNSQLDSGRHKPRCIPLKSLATYKVDTPSTASLMGEPEDDFQQRKPEDAIGRYDGKDEVRGRSTFSLFKMQIEGQRHGSSSPDVASARNEDVTAHSHTIRPRYRREGKTRFITRERLSLARERR